MKTCSKCRVVKEFSEFYAHCDKVNGFESHCKSCKKIYYITNRDRLLNQKRISRKNNPIPHRNSAKKWTQNNKKRSNEYNCNYQKNRRKNDINYKLKCYLRTQITAALNGNNKSESTLNMLGCSIEFLKNHLELNFLSGMNWGNYGKGAGKWSIDHIICCGLFDLSDIKQQRVCFHYTNLQPMWDLNNTAKNDFLSDKRQARNLTSKEKLEYLKSLGYDFSKKEEVICG
jgi:hypothetical protein